MIELHNAIQAHKAGDLERAKKLYEQVLKKNPNDFNAKQLLGALYAAKGNYALASRFFYESLMVNPKQPHVHNNLANCLVKQRKYVEAVSSFENAISQKKDYLEAYKGLITILIDVGDFEKAKKAISEGLRIFPKQLQILVKKAELCRALEDFDVAIDIYEDILREAPDLVTVRHNYAVVLRLSGFPEKAVKELLLLINAGMNNFQIYHNLGNAYADLGNLDKAIPAYQKAITINPYYVESHKNLNDALWEIGNESDFLTSYLTTMASPKCTPEVIFSYCEVLLRVSHFSDVIMTLNRNKELLKEDIKYFSLLAKAHRGLDEISLALSHIQLAMAMGLPSNVQRIGFAEIYIVAGEYSAAEEQLKFVLETDPNDQLALAYKGVCWRLTGDHQHKELNNYSSLVKEYLIEAPIGYENTSNFFTDLKQYLEKLHTTKFQPLDQTLHQGTQTRGNLFDVDNPLLEQLKEQLIECINDYCRYLDRNKQKTPWMKNVDNYKFSGSWSVSLSNQGYHNSHVHPMGWLSSVFYVDLPDIISDSSEREGWLKFGECFIGHKKFTSPEKEVKPVVGKLVLFPSYMWHGTNSFTSSQKRLTIAFDVAEK